MSEHWDTLSSTVLVDASPRLRLSQDRVRLPDDRVIDDYYRLEIPDFTAVFARDESGRVITLRQYKYALGRESLTFPGGQVEPGEDPLLCAKRELIEETGFVAPWWTSLGSFVVNGNLGAGHGHFYLAVDACEVGAPHSGDLENMTVEFMDIREVEQRLLDGDVGLLNHAAMIGLALSRIRSSPVSPAFRLLP